MVTQTQLLLESGPVIINNMGKLYCRYSIVQHFVLNTHERFNIQYVDLMSGCQCIVCNYRNMAAAIFAQYIQYTSCTSCIVMLRNRIDLLKANRLCNLQVQLLHSLLNEMTLSFAKNIQSHTRKQKAFLLVHD